MKYFLTITSFLLLSSFVHTQAILPEENTEFCPNTEYTLFPHFGNTCSFCVTLVGQLPSTI